MNVKRRTFLTLAGAASAAAALPRVGFAQQIAKVPRVALASSGVATTAMVIGGDANWSAILERLVSHGFVEGRTVKYERYFAPSDDTAADSARRIIESAPDMIFWGGASGAAKAAIAINKTIPMVAFLADLLSQGVVGNVAHPGGNITGISANASPESQGKMISLLLEVAPSTKRLAYLIPGDKGTVAPTLKFLFDAEVAAAANLGVTLVPVFYQAGANTDADYAKMFADVAANKSDAVHLSNDVTVQFGAPTEAKLALNARLPAIGPWNAFTDAGGLMSYGPDYIYQSQQSGDYIALVLTGTKPGDLPVLEPDKFNFVINLATAKAIGVSVPSSLIAQATSVIQ